MKREIQTSAAFIILFILFFSTGVFAQAVDYDFRWRQVDSLNTYDLPKSAEIILGDIYSTAKKENNTINYLRAWLYRIKEIDYYKGDDFFNILREIKKEESGSEFPAKQILNYLIGDMYRSYYSANRYTLLERTKMTVDNADDVKTWDATRFIEEIINCFNNSIAEPERLQQIHIENYNEILNNYVYDGKIPNGRKYRPTLYDFLAFNAVECFSNTETGIIRPAEQFLMNDSVYTSDAGDFIKNSILTNDQYSLEYHAIKIFREIIKFHLYDENPEALVDADLMRLLFVKENSGNPAIEDLYIKALQRMHDKYEDNPVSSMIANKMAVVYQERGDKYKPGVNDEYKDDLRKSYSLCKNSADKFPESDGAQYCLALMDMLNRKYLELKHETCNTPNKPFKALVTYRNISKLYIKIIAVSPKDVLQIEKVYHKSRFNRRQIDSTIIEIFKTKSGVSRFSVDIPNDGDYMEHCAEIKLPPLPAGLYILQTGTDETFSGVNNIAGYSLLRINSISFISKSNYDDELEFFVLDRDTGVPLEGAIIKANIKREITNNENKDEDDEESINTKNETKEVEEVRTYISDRDGYFKIENTGDYEKFYLDIEYKDQFFSSKGYDFERAYTGDEFTQYGKKTPTNKTYTYFFKDRAIYRPGQTLYFKGITVNTIKGNESLAANKQITVELYDARDYKIAEKVFTTNEYGTFNGSFVLPLTDVTGRLEIRVPNYEGESRFDVEDYKRPAFEVKFNPFKGSPKPGDSVKVTGYAKSYSGAGLSNAKVVYNVERSVTYPNWYTYWSYNAHRYNGSNYTSILKGKTTTNSDGGFEVYFTAKADESISKEISPYFNYEITADITDINGETHTKNTSVSVGYNPLLLYVDVGNYVDINSEKTFKVITSNHNGEKTPAAGTIEIYRLKSPTKIFRERMWEKPDKFTMTKEEYYGYFPYDEYCDETDYTTWEKEMKVFEKSINTALDSSLVISGMENWQQGKYYMEMKVKDEHGEESKEYFYFTAYSRTSSSLPVPVFFEYFTNDKYEYETGENLEIMVGSPVPGSKALFEIEGTHGLIKREWISLNNEKKFIKFPIEETSKGNLVYNIAFVNSGRLISKEEFVEVTNPDSKLDISVSSFRNKIHPGDKEEWKIKIKDRKGRIFPAEMVATIYDASLDAISEHEWPVRGIFDYYNFRNHIIWENNVCFKTDAPWIYPDNWSSKSEFRGKKYDGLNRFLSNKEEDKIYYYLSRDRDRTKQIGYIRSSTEINESGNLTYERPGQIQYLIDLERYDPPNPLERFPKKKEENEIPKTRKDFRETVFFKPDLRTDENGEITISFVTPDALTKWKFMGFAHTKDLKRGMITKEFVTQKELMVTPNVPRYLREDDKVILSARITNITDKPLKGEAFLVLTDGVTMKNADTAFRNINSMKVFSADNNSSTVVNWEISVPYGFESVQYKITAEADNFSDGEEALLPVLSNRMLVTETMPMSVKGAETKTFSMNGLLNNNSNSLTNYKLSLEFTGNPAWYALQSLPYLMEFPHECAEQVFSRIYANSIGTFVVNGNPKIKEIFGKWKNENPDAFLSNLEKNEELKGLLLQETPWVMDAKNESERKRRMGNLFELKKMVSELDASVTKLKKMQAGSGGWPWFEGMPEDRYITQHITAGLGKLYKLGIRKQEDDIGIIVSALSFINRRLQDDYDRLNTNAIKNNVSINDDNLGYAQIQYLYARSFYKDIPIEGYCKDAFEYYKGQAAKYWNGKNIYSKGMIALALYRYGDSVTAGKIVNSLREYSTNSDESGMYWKDNSGGYYWYEAPIETQALMIEVFDEVAHDEKSVDGMKVWLLKNKQTNNWQTTKATVEAVYALMPKGENWLATESPADIIVGSQKIDMSGVEPGTGYFKTNWQWGEVKPEMGKVTVSRKPETGISWGALYWQYFQDIDKITKQETSLKVEKKLFKVEYTSEGEVIKPIDSTLKVGDKVRVRIELRSDRDMEYVHMKDMRAAGFEPLNVLSGYKYQGGLGFYESTRDAATNFFFNYLKKGTYVFEYDLRVNLSGDFSNGITTIQCMYAPEFASHSEGARVVISN
ncbi:MAG: MG2 domain-containing protein [Bacteroidetes bacterium]|nr:MG2 domain-containing protein [Bacteroidota bacterium]